MKNITMATFATAIIFSSTVAAHQSDDNNYMGFSSDSCNVQFNNKLTINPSNINIEAVSGLMTIEQDGRLLINNNPLTVSTDEQQKLVEYSTSLRQSVPKVADVALEGVAIAGIALKEVGEAFELDNMDAMNEFMSEVSKKIQNSFYNGESFVVDQGRFDSLDNTFDSEFDEQVSELMKEMIMDSMGSILMKIGSEMLYSGGDLSEFEQRMEKMGEQIDENVTYHAEKLEHKAESLCSVIKQLAEQEQQLQNNIPVIKDYDIFTIKS